MKLDIIVTLFNKENEINDYYNDLKELLNDIKYNIIFVDNGSTDDSLNELKELHKKDEEHIKIVSLSKNFCNNAAIYAGLENSKNDLICTLNFNDDISYIYKMYKFLKENKEFDAICMCKKEKKKFFRNILLNIANKVNKININDDISHIKMFKKNMLPSITKLSEKYGYSNALFNFIGFNIYYDYSYMNKYEREKVLKYIFNYSFKPLKLITYTGLIVCILSIIYFVLSLTIINSKVSLIISIILIMSGIQFVFLGLLSTYITKILKVNNYFPIYISKEKIGFDENYL